MRSFKLLFVFFCYLTFLNTSCSIDTESDDIPTSFKPVNWNDNMIFLATDEGPPQVQIWDTETRKLVRRIMLPEYMFFGNILVTDKECMWVNLSSISKEYLIQFDAINGKIKIMDLDIEPGEIQFINGVLWVWDPYSSLGDPVKFRRFDRKGKLQQSVTLNRNDIYTIGQDSIVYDNGDFLIPFRTNHNRFYISNLSNGAVTTEIPLDALFPGGLLENFSTVVYDSSWVDHPDPSSSSTRFYEEGYVDVLYTRTRSIPSWRWFYKIESYNPFKLSSSLITYNREQHRSNLFLSKTDEHLFVGGNISGGGRGSNIEGYRGIEIGVYPKDGGEELTAFRLFNANAHYVKRDGEIWIGKDIWTWNQQTEKWNFKGETQAYFMDLINLKLYLVNADGTVVLVQEMPDLNN